MRLLLKIKKMNESVLFLCTFKHTLLTVWTHGNINKLCFHEEPLTVSQQGEATLKGLR